MQTVFSRPWTRLFTLSHKYKEVADRDTVGHRGTPIGHVEKIVDPNSEHAMLRFTTARPIERHDGLQIDVPGLGKPFGFAVETLRCCIAGVPSARTVFEAPANALVEVAIPEEHPFIPDGAPIYCSSSQDVKRRYRHDRPKPGLYKTRRVVDVDVKLSAEALTVCASIEPHVLGKEWSLVQRVRRVLAGPFSVAKDAAKMSAAARGAFEKLGETRLELGAFSFENPDSRFVPVSQINALRRDVADELERRIHATLAQRLDAVRADVLPSEKRRLPRSPSDPKWSIKVDRIGFLDAFENADFDGVEEVAIDIARDHAAILDEKIARLAARIGRERVRLALPPVTRKWEENGIQLKLARLRGAGFSKWEAGNVSAWSYLNALDFLERFGQAGRPAGTGLSTDWSVYWLL